MTATLIPTDAYDRSRQFAITLYKLAVRDGGATLDPETGEPHAATTGYYVGIHPYTYRREDRSSRNVVRYLTSGIWRLTTDDYPGALLGAWVDGETIHLDPVVHVLDRAEAETIGRLHSQRAIYDIARKETVTL